MRNNLKSGVANEKKVASATGKLIYEINGKIFESKFQTKMMYDFFEELVNLYPEKIADLPMLTDCVRVAKDVTDANTKYSIPRVFRGSKRFDVNGTEYLLGMAYNIEEKLKHIDKMISVCGAPKEFFVLVETEQRYL